MKLTEYQKQTILELFFKNDKYPGWKSIAEKLLENGNCIVAGLDGIWKGGVGNYIKVDEHKDAVGCSLYTFDLVYFMTSEWVSQILQDYKADLIEKRDTLIKQTLEIDNLLKK